MFKKDVLTFFGSGKRTALTLGLQGAAISKWSDLIPQKQAMRLNQLTNGKLEYRSELYEREGGNTDNRLLRDIASQAKLRSAHESVIEAMQSLQDIQSSLGEMLQEYDKKKE